MTSEQHGVTNDTAYICTVCLDTHTDKAHMTTLPCGHIFHSKCVIEYFVRGKTKSTECPLCRAIVFERVKEPDTNAVQVQPGRVTIEISNPSRQHNIRSVDRGGKCVRCIASFVVIALCVLMFFGFHSLMNEVHNKSDSQQNTESASP